MKTLNLTVMTLLIAASATLKADGGDKAYRPYLALGPTFAQGNARDLTQSSNGINSWTGEMGVEFYNPIARIHMRPNFGVAKMYGVEKPETWDWPTYQMLGWYGGLDLVYKNPRGWPVNLTIGPSFHVWNVEKMYVIGDTEQDEQSIKLGWRGGVAYEINDMLNVELSYTMAEWRSRNGEAFQPGLNPSRPMYFSLKVFYKF
jgi:opacity protein-like surface antigen